MSTVVKSQLGLGTRLAGNGRDLKLFLVMPLVYYKQTIITVPGRVYYRLGREHNIDSYIIAAVCMITIIITAHAQFCKQ